LSTPQHRTDVRPGYPRPADPRVALRVTRTLSVGPGGAFERRGSSQPYLDAVGRLAVAREKAPSDEVVDDQAGYGERDVRHAAPEAAAVARLLDRGRRAPPRARSAPGRSIWSSREATPRCLLLRASGEVSEQLDPVGFCRERGRCDQNSCDRAVVE